LLPKLEGVYVFLIRAIRKLYIESRCLFSYGIGQNLSANGSYYHKKVKELTVTDTLKLKELEYKVAAGFPNPCEEYLSKPISLDGLLIKRHSSTFLVRVSGDSMAPTIPHGALLVVDKSIHPRNNNIVVAVVDNEFIVKELITPLGTSPILHSHN